MEVNVGSTSYSVTVSRQKTLWRNINLWGSLRRIALIVLMAGVFHAFGAKDARADYLGFESFTLVNNSSYDLVLNNSWTQPDITCFCGYFANTIAPETTIPANTSGGWDVGTAEFTYYSWGVQYGVVIPGTNNLFSQYCTMNGYTPYSSDNISTTYGCTNNQPQYLLKIAFYSDEQQGKYVFSNPDTPIGSVDLAAIGSPPPVAVPEPSSVALFGIGFTGLLFRRRRAARRQV